MRLVSIAIDGRPLEGAEYAVGPDMLTIFNPPSSFTLEVVTELKPQENTALKGLYVPAAISSPSARPRASAGSPTSWTART